MTISKCVFYAWIVQHKYIFFVLFCLHCAHVYTYSHVYKIFFFNKFCFYLFLSYIVALKHCKKWDSEQNKIFNAFMKYQLCLIDFITFLYLQYTTHPYMFLQRLSLKACKKFLVSIKFHYPIPFLDFTKIQCDSVLESCKWNWVIYGTNSKLLLKVNLANTKRFKNRNPTHFNSNPKCTKINPYFHTIIEK